jgi:hypothetical protein
MGVPTLTKAERALRRAVNPLSTAVTMLVQTSGRRARRIRPNRRISPRGAWPPDDDGGAGVREPRRPLPTGPQDAMALDLPE